MKLVVTFRLVEGDGEVIADCTREIAVTTADAIDDVKELVLDGEWLFGLAEDVETTALGWIHDLDGVTNDT